MTNKVDLTSLHVVHKLRLRYAGQGLAFDALLYYLLGEDAPAKIQAAMAFLASPAGGEWYADVHRALDPDRVYDFDRERAKALAAPAAKGDGRSSPMTPAVLLREMKRISS